MRNDTDIMKEQLKLYLYSDGFDFFRKLFFGVFFNIWEFYEKGAKFPGFFKLLFRGGRIDFFEKSFSYP